MTLEEAFAILELPPDATTKDVRRAYVRLIKLHKPDRDPEAFRRIRAAFELAKAFGNPRAPVTTSTDQPTAPESSEAAGGPPPTAGSFEHDVADATPDEPPSPPPTLEPKHDPVDMVDGALDRGQYASAYERVMSDDWAQILVLDPRAAEVTRRMACAAILPNAAAFLALEHRYADVLAETETPFGEVLLQLRLIANEWIRFRALRAVPDALVAFVEAYGGSTPDQRRQWAKVLCDWLMTSPAQAVRTLSWADDRTEALLPVLSEWVDHQSWERVYDGAPPPEPAQGTRSPSDVLRPLLMGTLVTQGVVSAAVVYTTIVRGGGVGGWVLGATVCFVLVYALRQLQVEVFDAFPRLRARYLLACVEQDVSPRDHAKTLKLRPYLRTRIVEDGALELAYRVGALSRLLQPPANGASR